MGVGRAGGQRFSSGLECGGLRRLLSWLGRLGVALTLTLLALAVARWEPIGARSPLDVRALPLALPLVGCAILAALCGGERPGTRWRPVAAALVAALAALALAVALRGPAGLEGAVRNPAGSLVGKTPPGAVDLIGRDLRPFAPVRRLRVAWAGELRVPQSGRYRLWLEGRGRGSVALEGRPLLEGEGDPLRAGVETALARGPLRLEVRFEQTGPGPRLRLGWTRPDGRSERSPRATSARPSLGGNGRSSTRCRCWWRCSPALSRGSRRGNARTARRCQEP